MPVDSPVLAVDDDPNDLLFLEWAFESAGVRKPLVTARGGQEAIDYLAGDRKQHPLPCLVLVDLKMPKVGGFAVLKWLQGQKQFSGLPVIVLSGSAQRSDIQRAVELGARGYFMKPCGLEGLVEVVKKLQAWWSEPKCGGGATDARGPLPAV